jgi:hypothetical protein
MDSTYHYPVKLIFQAHLRMYSLIHTDSLAQPRKLLCFKVFAMYSQCKVFLHLNYIHKISLNKVQYNQQNITRTENNGESSSAKFGSENAQCLFTKLLYKVGFNFNLEIIRLKLAKFRLNTPIHL